jgi:hypothetical protein
MKSPVKAKVGKAKAAIKAKTATKRSAAKKAKPEVAKQ